MIRLFMAISQRIIEVVQDAWVAEFTKGAPVWPEKFIALILRRVLRGGSLRWVRELVARRGVWNDEAEFACGGFAVMALFAALVGLFAPALFFRREPRAERL
jgi:hypothetical protein